MRRSLRRGAVRSPLVALLLALTPPPAAAVGPGDCDNDDRVTVPELVTGVGITLGAAPLERCAALDFDLDGAPYRGRDAGLQASLDGFLLNPMLQPEASKIALWTAGRFFALGEDYDPELAIEQAIERASGGGGADVVATLAEHFRSHPLIGDQPEAPQLAAAMADFLAEGGEERRDRLVARLDELADIDVRLAATLANRALALELAEPAQKLALSAAAALLAVDLLERKRAGESVDDAELRAALSARDEIPWLVAANTFLDPALATLIGQRPVTEADVFGDFFAAVLAEVNGGAEQARGGPRD
jgi:hypothetical protein